MSIQISSHEKKRAAGLNHWDGREGFLGGLDLQLGLDEELVQLSFVKAWVMEAEEENFVGSVVCFQIVLSRSSFEAYHMVSISTPVRYVFTPCFRSSSFPFKASPMMKR